MEYGIIAICAMSFGLALADEGRIKIYDENPRYWSYKGNPVLLLGGSDEDNLFNHPEMMMRNLETLDRIGGNYIRGTLSCRDEGNVWPFEKAGDKYDLERFNPEFWDRLERCLKEAYRRDIIVQIEIWATFDYYGDRWLRNPFNPAMNVNYTTDDTHLVERWDYHPAHKPQPFFHSPPGLNDDRVLLRYQEAFVRKVLDISLPYPNVLYCLDNETRAPAEWALYWGRFINEEARKQGVEVNLTEMWDPWDLRDAQHSTTYEHPELFSFTDVSQNNWQQGEVHYQRLIWYRDNLKEHGGPRPMNNVKIYGCERPRLPAIPELNVDRFWKCIFAGCASARFHRPPSGMGLNEVAQRAIKAARIFTSSFDIFQAEPRLDLLLDREEDEAYCLAIPGEVYALYLPKGGEVCLKVRPKDMKWLIRWFDPSTSTFMEGKTAQGETIHLKSPDGEQTWLVLIESEHKG
jgi:hypothetical protein